MTIKHKILLILSKWRSKQEVKQEIKNIKEKTFLDLLNETKAGYEKDLSELLYLVESDYDVQNTLEIKIAEISKIIEIYTEYGR